MLLPKKILALFLAITLNWGLLFAIRDTFAYFNDAEQSNTQLVAGILDVAVSGDSGFDGLIMPSNPLVRQIDISNNGTLPFNYSFKLNNLSGNAELYNELNLKVLLDTTEIYSGPLILFLSATSSVPLSTSTIAHLKLSISLNSEELSLWNKTCNFNIDFIAWQDNLASSSQGFFDIETINNTINSGVWGVVLNEFLPNPNGFEYGFDFGEDGDSMPKGEWVELYNNDNFNHDLTGWYIQNIDNHRIYITTANTDLATTTITPYSFLVVYMNQAILNNSETETVSLFDDSDDVKDLYTYSNSEYCQLEPTEGEANTTTPTGSCGGVPGNKSYARIPDGTGNWVDPIPTPGISNILENKIESMILQENVFLVPVPVLNIKETNQKPQEATTNTPETIVDNPINNSENSTDSVAIAKKILPETQNNTEPEENIIVEETPAINEQVLPTEEEQPTPQEVIQQEVEVITEKTLPAIEPETQTTTPEITNTPLNNNEKAEAENSESNANSETQNNE
ncbi:MAG: TasA family protein [Candidatus Pacebacteria bacterium]|nr:TasA family protein [Candidatus Paceibacterota bacterium]